MALRHFVAISARFLSGLRTGSRFKVRGPFGGDPIKLIFGILKRDMRIEPGSGSHNQVPGNILKVNVRMFLSPHQTEGRLDVRPILHWFYRGLSLAVGSCSVTTEPEICRGFRWRSSRGSTARSAAFGSGVSGILLDPLGYQIRMRLGPIVHVRGVCWVPGHPGLGKGVVQVCPLSHDVRFPLVQIFLKPAFDIRRHKLSCLGAASVFHDWTERPGDAVAQPIVGGCQADDDELDAS